MERLAAAHEQYETQNADASPAYLSALEGYIEQRVAFHLYNPKSSELDLALFEDEHLLQWALDMRFSEDFANDQLALARLVIAGDLAERDAEDADYDTVMGTYDWINWK